MTKRTQKQRVAIKRVGSSESRAETLSNSPVVVRDLSGPLCPSSSPATLYSWGVPS